MKSHFQFSTKQRHGIFLLVVVIICLQLVYHFVDFPTNNVSSVSQEELENYRAEVKVLKDTKLKNTRPKIYPFNPNFISDYKGYTLGMSNEEIDRLHQFRAQNKWVNSAKQFQEVTKVSDALLDSISPYFKFPEWVTNPKPKPKYTSYSNTNTTKSFEQKQDLNTANAQQLQKVYGVGKTLSQRILDYRNRFEGGFIADAELAEIWGLKPEVIERIRQHFTVKTPRIIQKFHLNTASTDQLVTIPHIDYEIAKHIIEERLLRDGYKSLDDLTKVEQFPTNKLEIIKLYLQL